MTQSPIERHAEAIQCSDCGKTVPQTFHGLCADCIADSMDYEEPEMDDDEAFLAFECGMMADGYCSKAGTEECDWECSRGRLA